MATANEINYFRGNLIKCDYPNAQLKSDEEIETIISSENRTQLLTWMLTSLYEFLEMKFKTAQNENQLIPVLMKTLNEYGFCIVTERDTFFVDSDTIPFSEQIPIFDRMFQMLRVKGKVREYPSLDNDLQNIIVELDSCIPNHVDEMDRYFVTNENILPLHVMQKKITPEQKSEMGILYEDKIKQILSEIESLRNFTVTYNDANENDEDSSDINETLDSLSKLSEEFFKKIQTNEVFKDDKNNVEIGNAVARANEKLEGGDQIFTGIDKFHNSTLVKAQEYVNDHQECGPKKTLITPELSEQLEIMKSFEDYLQ